MKKLTREWLSKAEVDYLAAGKLARGSDPFHDQVCFHCQQAAEKYLKALLEELGVAVPRTQVLLDPLKLLFPHHPSLRSLRRYAGQARCAAKPEHSSACGRHASGPRSLRDAARSLEEQSGLPLCC